MSAPLAPAAPVVWLRLPRMHPWMILPAALLAALMLPLVVLAAAVAIAAAAVGGATYPVLAALHSLFIAVINYGQEVA